MNIQFQQPDQTGLLLALLVLLIWVAIKELFFCMPGLLGAVTLYILSRANLFQLVHKKKWKKGRAAGLFLIYYLILIGIPIFLAITLISPKVNAFLSDPGAAVESIKQAAVQVQEKMGSASFLKNPWPTLLIN